MLLPRIFFLCLTALFLVSTTQGQTCTSTNTRLCLKGKIKVRPKKCDCALLPGARILDFGTVDVPSSGNTPASPVTVGVADGDGCDGKVSVLVERSKTLREGVVYSSGFSSTRPTLNNGQLEIGGTLTVDSGIPTAVESVTGELRVFVSCTP